MPNTGPVRFYWVGGSTGTTSASRFDWNVASNWRILKNNSQAASNKNLTTTTKYPMGGDIVSIGYGWNSSGVTAPDLQIKSPLLFGGFSGSGFTGCWVCDGGTGAGLSGASGTTFDTALYEFTVGQDYPAKFNVAILGAGLTGSVSYWDTVDLLVETNTSGMGQADWISLSGSATTRQSSLNIKSNNISLYTDSTSGSASNMFWFKPNIIDNYVQIGGNTGSINTYVRLMGDTKSVFTYINGAKLAGIYSGILGTIELANCKVKDIVDFGKVSYFITDSDCLIGLFRADIQTPSYHKAYQLAGTFKNREACKALGITGVTFDASSSEVSIFGRSYNKANVILGGITGDGDFSFGGTGYFVANKVSVEYEYQRGMTGPVNPDDLIPVAINRRTTIDNLTLKGCNLYTTMVDNSIPITIKQVDLWNNSKIDLTYNSGLFNSWRFGIAQGAAAGITLQGGVVFNTPNTRIIGDPGIKFVNYSVDKNTGYDSRTGKFNTSDSEGTVIAL